MIRISRGIFIPRGEIAFSASRSGGPGGQHVNKTSSRISLAFSVAGSSALTEAQKHLIRRRLGRRVSGEGVLRVVSQRHRSQAANRVTALERFIDLLRQALREMPARVKTRLPAAARKRRLEVKRRRGEHKRLRSERFTRED